VKAAFACEKLLRETDNVLSAIRIVDLSLVDFDQPMPEGKRRAIQFAVFINFVGGRGEKEASFLVFDPNGNLKGEPWSQVLSLSGREAEQYYFEINVTLNVEIEGVYWLELRFGGEPLTRIPIHVERARPSPGSPEQRS
jgi:hypothetical protein